MYQHERARIRTLGSKAVALFGLIVWTSMRWRYDARVERDALWRAIMESPEDNEPRLVFADWLLQRDEPLGELIAIQCSASFATNYSLKVRAAELVRTHGARWNAELGLGDASISYERGLPHLARVRLHAEALEIVERAPIRWIRFHHHDPATDPIESMRAIANDPRLARVHALNTYGGETCLHALLASSYLAMRKLIVEGRECTSGAARALAEANLPLLETLSLSGALGSTWGDADTGVLARANLPALRELYIHSLDVGADTLRHVASSTFERLETLAISSERGLQDGIAALAASSNFTRLTTLDLSRCQLADLALVALASSDALPALRRLDLALNRITDEGVVALASTSGMLQLESLDLAYASITSAGVATYARTLQFAKLRELSLRANTRGPEIAIAIAESPHATNLRELDLSELVGRDAAAFALAQSPYLANLETLTFYKNKVTHAGRAALHDRFGERALVDL